MILNDSETLQIFYKRIAIATISIDYFCFKIFFHVDAKL